MARESVGLLQPTFFDTPIHNIPPIYSFFLSIWGAAFGFTDLWLRIPSLIAWAVAALPIRRLGGDLAALAWMSFPLSFILAGRVMPDMLLACLVAYGLEAGLAGRLKPFLAYLVLAVLVKPIAVVLVLVPLVRRWWDCLEILTVLGVVVGAVLGVSGYGAMILQHFVGRWPGYWDFERLFIGCLGALSTLGLVAFTRPGVNNRNMALWSLLFGCFVVVGYAMPDFGSHEYYFLIALPVLAVLVGKAKPKPWLLAVAVAWLALSLFQSGDLWDDRTSRMPDADAAQQGLGTVASWYGGAHVNQTAPGVRWAWSPEPNCTTLEVFRAPVGIDRPLYALAC